jgi:hypothetical protein
MPSDAPTPALVKVRIADRRISCGVMPSRPAFLTPTLNGRRKDLIGLPLDERQKGTPAHSLLKSPLDNRSQFATSANVRGRLVFSSLRLSLMTNPLYRPSSLQFLSFTAPRCRIVKNLTISCTSESVIFSTPASNSGRLIRPSRMFSPSSSPTLVIYEISLASKSSLNPRSKYLTSD